MDMLKLPSEPTVSVEVMASVLADCEAARLVTSIEKELAIADELAEPVTVVLLLDEKVLAPQFSVDNSAEEASCKLANCDFTVPKDESWV
jgi:hypothetical protein